MKRLLAFGAAMMFTAQAATAQRSQRGSTPIEFGIDGGVIFGLDAPRQTVVALPLQDFRIGFLVSDKVALEPRFNLNSRSGAGPSVTAYDFEMGVVYQPLIGLSFFTR